MAATYHWTPRQVERELTDELLVLYLDAAVERRQVLFDADVAAVRAGTIFAHDQKQYDRWQADNARRTGQRQAGKPLAQLARDLGAEIGGMSIVRGEFEFRN